MEFAAEKIKKKRERLGMTQKEMADVIGLGKYGDRTVRRWENAESNPSEVELKFIMELSEEPRYANPPLEQARFKTIDLFAGIGGIRLAFHKLGAYSVFSSEWDKFSQKTYKANFGEIPHGDITKVHEDDIPDHDILLAGFPCQPFSQAGLKKGFEDTRGTLFHDIARIIAKRRPKAFLLENVKQLYGHDKGRTFKTIKSVLEELDYSVDESVLRAADFGVPQNRERIYIVGFDNKQGGRKVMQEFIFPIPPKTKTRVGNILEKRDEKYFEKYTISDKLYEGHMRRKEMHKQKGNGFGFSLFNEDSEYTNTISARYYKDGSEILIEQPGKNPRKLTPTECARLQGFPDDFVIPVSDSQAYRQFGNSVAVPVVEEIAKEMLKAMSEMLILEREENGVLV
ncbi:DNA (cytosine-5-)-methyltransferase [Paenibacillus sp. LMG 31458]|uniref:Cytosine-specific methyltransferase n=1 Tax=Paenibacillus phytorum TaxID=2654977 RepID=A0ABX1Y139_9BACL|nr:DNA (cytosine-5-)-methyltransferase [Paenibacillus phytorum]NOU73986.1 DNA (cytosine-5-)-methyltransferase [Paenibacillus phytorum]